MEHLLSHGQTMFGSPLRDLMHNVMIKHAHGVQRSARRCVLALVVALRMYALPVTSTGVEPEVDRFPTTIEALDRLRQATTDVLNDPKTMRGSKAVACAILALEVQLRRVFTRIPDLDIEALMPLHDTLIQLKRTIADAYAAETALVRARPDPLPGTMKTSYELIAIVDLTWLVRALDEQMNPGFPVYQSPITSYV